MANLKKYVLKSGMILLKNEFENYTLTMNAFSPELVIR